MSWNKQLVGYRQLLQSSKRLFKQDLFALREFKTQLKAEFIKAKFETDKEKIAQHLKNIEEAKEFLELNLIQAQLNKKGSYEVVLPKVVGHADAELEIIPPTSSSTTTKTTTTPLNSIIKKNNV